MKNNVRWFVLLALTAAGIVWAAPPNTGKNQPAEDVEAARAAVEPGRTRTTTTCPSR